MLWWFVSYWFWYRFGNKCCNDVGIIIGKNVVVNIDDNVVHIFVMTLVMTFGDNVGNAAGNDSGNIL